MKKNKKDTDKHKLLVYMPYVVLHVLLKYNALSAWYNNMLLSSPPFTAYVDFARLHEPERWIDYAFLWTETPEGGLFWSYIYEEIKRTKRSE